MRGGPRGGGRRRGAGRRSRCRRPNPGNVVGEVADQGRTVAPLIRGHMESPGYLFRGDDSLAGWPGGVEDLHPVAQELVEVAVPAEDVAVLPRCVPGGGGGDVVRLVLADLGPRQADGVKAALDVGQVLDRERGLLRAVGLVAGVDGLAARGPRLSVEDDQDLRPAGEVLPDGLAEESEEHEDPGQVPASVTAGNRCGSARSRHPQEVVAIDEHEVSAVHDAGPRLARGTTLAEPAARPARAAFSRVRALIVVA